MPSATILIADGTEEIEFVTPYDVLIRAGFEVQSIGVELKSSYATCTRRVRIVPDSTTLPSQPSTDILILPGGAPGAKTFCSDAATQKLIRSYRDSGRWTGFLCASTTALAASVDERARKEEEEEQGIESAKRVRVTSHPAVKDEIVKAGWDYAPDEERVVIDGKVITSRGPGTALLFALTIVEALAGKAKRDEVAGPMICAQTL